MVSSFTKHIIVVAVILAVVAILMMATVGRSFEERTINYHITDDEIPTIVLGEKGDQTAVLQSAEERWYLFVNISKDPKIMERCLVENNFTIRILTEDHCVLYLADLRYPTGRGLYEKKYFCDIPLRMRIIRRD